MTINSVPSSLLSLKILIANTEQNNAIVTMINVWHIGIVEFDHTCKTFILARYGNKTIKTTTMNIYSSHVNHNDFFFNAPRNENL